MFRNRHNYSQSLVNIVISQIKKKNKSKKIYTNHQIALRFLRRYKLFTIKYWCFLIQWKIKKILNFLKWKIKKILNFLFSLVYKFLVKPFQDFFKRVINFFWKSLPTSEWVKLLAAPLFLSFTGTVITFWFQEENKQTEIVNKYFDQMEKLFLDPKLNFSESENPIKLLIKSRSLSTLRNVNLTQKEVIISFLSESDILNFSSDKNSLRLDYFNLTEKYFDLTKLEAKFQNLRGINLSGFNLKGVSLRNSNLTQSNLRGTNFFGADLSGANLERADLEGTNFFGADLSGANLERANLYQANLERADLLLADLERADLLLANLERADLSGANLSRVSLSGANLKGAKLSRVSLFGANLYQANLSGVSLSGADLYQVDFKRANLEEANFLLANLKGANLEEVNLEGANLKEANLSGVNLKGANLKGANLKQAYLYQIQFLDIKQLKSVINWEQAIYTEAEWDNSKFQWIPKDKVANEAKIEEIRNLTEGIVQFEVPKN